MLMPCMKNIDQFCVQGAYPMHETHLRLVPMNLEKLVRWSELLILCYLIFLHRPGNI